MSRSRSSSSSSSSRRRRRRDRHRSSSERKRDRSRSREARSSSSDALGRVMRPLDQIEDDEAMAAAKEIKRLAQVEVDLYINSDDFKAMIERMKQREC